jgi:hypothetical protein
MFGVISNCLVLREKHVHNLQNNDVARWGWGRVKHVYFAHFCLRVGAGSVVWVALLASNTPCYGAAAKIPILRIYITGVGV